MSYFKITLHRSAIGLPERTRGVLAALGLRRRTQTVFHPASPQFAGMILKVKELVRVEEVDTVLTKAQMKDARRPDPGFYVERPVSGAASGSTVLSALGAAGMGMGISMGRDGVQGLEGKGAEDGERAQEEVRL